MEQDLKKGSRANLLLNWRSRWQGWRKQEHVCNDLLSSERILQHLDLKRRRDLGPQQVDLTRIVGSSGRSQQFDLDFNPRQLTENGRWQQIAQARQGQKELPPVVLLKVGNAYLVEDGNHRISVARSRGETTIQARVMELDVSPLKEKESCSRLGYKV